MKKSRTIYAALIVGLISILPIIQAQDPPASPGRIGPASTGTVTPSDPGTISPVAPGPITPQDTNNYVGTFEQDLSEAQRDQAIENLSLNLLGTSQQPLFSVDPADPANATTTTAEIQAAFDTGRNIFFPEGKYYLNSTVTLKTVGQVIQGESMMRTVLIWTADVDCLKFRSGDDPPSSVIPGVTSTNTSYGSIRDLAIVGTGKSTSTSKGLSNEVSGVDTFWVGEGWDLSSVWFSQLKWGIHSVDAGRWHGSGMVTFHLCQVGMYLSTATLDTDSAIGGDTNNCQRFSAIGLAGCDLGLELKGVNAGSFSLQDVGSAGTGIHVKVSDSHCSFIGGGEMEQATPTSFDVTNSALVIEGMRWLHDVNTIPVIANSNSVVEIRGCSVDQAGSMVPVAQADQGSRVFGWTNRYMLGAAPGSILASKVRIKDAFGNDRDVLLSPFPWTTTDFPITADSVGALHWQPGRNQNGRGLDDLVGYIETTSGTHHRARVFDTNYFGIEVDGSAPTFYTTQSWENVIYISKAGNQNVNLVPFGGNNYRATTSNGRLVTIVNETDTGTKTVNAGSGEAFYSSTLNGVGSIIIPNNASARLLSRGNGRINVIIN